ncbi:Membrane dipeptidase (Peptidase family M19) [Frankia sp. AiPs1]|uniref:hypothetical protein n=1 Tax=Frankia sp. AiPa1 TaxID=573492 RepID=UPI00202B40DD|nr:hypothetical protein [Frankia sp. AiPa1]MCL9760412.1 hypothetical protein [Frankia sp. AiPa1]
MKRSCCALLILLLAGSLLASRAASADTPPAVQDLDGRCFIASVRSDGASASQATYVTQAAIGYRTDGTAAQAEPLMFAATALGHYLIYETRGQRLYQAVTDTVLGGSSYGTRADWTLARAGDAYRIVNTATGGQLGSRLGLLAAGKATVTLTAATGCYQVPEIGVNALDSTRPAGTNAAGDLVGLIDAHAHITASEAFGGSLRCGRPFAEGGVVEALAPCPSHGPLTLGALLEAIVGGTDPTASGQGWPTFTDWPEPDSQLHEQAYYTGIERAWRAGLRVMNTLLVANRVICELYPGSRTSCDEMEQIRRQAAFLYRMQDYIDARGGGAGKGWFRIATTPRQVRQIAAAGKLAVTIGIESSELFGCREINDVPQCTQADIDAGLNTLQSYGVSNIFPVHKFDNAFGGTRFDPGTTGVAINVANRISTGHWWQVTPCTGPSDNEQPLVSDAIAALLAKAGGSATLPAGTTLPVYPSGSVCNVRGLTALGAYLVRQAITRGMIINIDHMGVKTAEDVLNIVEAAHYPGVLSAHSWADRGIVDRVLADGGFVATYGYAAGDAGNGEPDFLHEWRANNALPHGGAITGYGYGSDVNGLAPQAPPRLNAAASPLAYPFTAPNGVRFDRHQYGQRTYDLNTDGVAEYGEYADWYADLIQQAGPDGPRLRGQLMNGAEAYVRMWEAARA